MDQGFELHDTLGAGAGEPPNVALVWRYRGRGGLSLDVQQQLTASLSLFARGGFAGGLGILVGDGQLPRPASENTLETYYDFGFGRRVNLTLD